MERVYNFAAGPACLPEEVLKKAQAEFMVYGTSGMNVMEMSHRSKDFDDILKSAEADLRTLMGIPDNYKVMFLQGGGSTQFAMVPMNLCKKGKAYYVKTGQWAKKAAEQAAKYLEVEVVASSEDKTYSYIPELNKDMFKDDADYVYICENNTIYGTHYSELPDTNGLTLVSDMSSCILSQKVDVTKYGLIFAGAQKNIGPAGVTIVIMREDLIRYDLPKFVPTMLTYKTHADAGSLFNTPPTYAIYMAGLVFKHLIEIGGVEAMEVINRRKAGKLYDFLDNSKLFKPTVVGKDRSLMNVPFITGDKDLDAEFVASAKENGFVNIKGHRTVGGMRASIYNAMPEAGVDALIEFMAAFEKNHK